MEITFSNKREDFEAFYNYMLKDTEQGMQIRKQAYRSRQAWTILAMAFLSAFFWRGTVDWKLGLSISFFFFALGEGIILIQSGFKPQYYFGKEIYKNGEKSMTKKDLDVFLLPRTITFDETWLELRNSEASHRYRWRVVDRIGLTRDFIFIHVGTCPIVYVPKREFSSEEKFLEFGRRLIELQEKNKNQIIGKE